MGTAELTRPRYDSVAALLPDGRALFIGGQTTTSHSNDADLYDPSSTNVVRVPTMSVGRAFGHTANVLTDGRVLVVGGYEPVGAAPLASADLFDPSLDGGLSPPIEEIDAGSDDAAVKTPDAAVGGPGLDAPGLPDVPTAPSLISVATDATPGLDRWSAGGASCSAAADTAATRTSALGFAAVVLAMARKKSKRASVSVSDGASPFARRSKRGQTPSSSWRAHSPQRESR